MSRHQSVPAWDTNTPDGVEHHTDPTPVDLAEYSRALDEIYYLRAILAQQANITKEYLSLRTFPKSRAKAALNQIEAMRQAARGNARGVYHTIAFPKAALRSAGAPDMLTRASWEIERG